MSNKRHFATNNEVQIKSVFQVYMAFKLETDLGLAKFRSISISNPTGDDFGAIKTQTEHQ